MSFGTRIKEHRRNYGLTQERVAELVGVSRQAVTKWESGQSAPSTENLFKLAEIFGTTVDLLLESDERQKVTPAEQLYELLKLEQEKKLAAKRKKQKRNILFTLGIAAGYLLFYLLGRIIWCDMGSSSLVGWLFAAKPTGAHSYLYGWLLSSDLFVLSVLISAVPALFGKFKYSFVTVCGFILGFLAGVLFGPNPDGAAIGQGHYGWAIWGIVYLLSIIAGIVVEAIGRAKARTEA